MRYLLAGTTSGWPIGQWLVPRGHIVDASVNDQWSFITNGRVPPMNAQALDQAAWDAMAAEYPNHKHLMTAGPGVNRT
jgi:hypothetical protein